MIGCRSKNYDRRDHRKTCSMAVSDVVDDDNDLMCQILEFLRNYMTKTTINKNSSQQQLSFDSSSKSSSSSSSSSLATKSLLCSNNYTNTNIIMKNTLIRSSSLPPPLPPTSFKKKSSSSSPSSTFSPTSNTSTHNIPPRLLSPSSSSSSSSSLVSSLSSSTCRQSEPPPSILHHHYHNHDNNKDDDKVIEPSNENNNNTRSQCQTTNTKLMIMVTNQDEPNQRLHVRTEGTNVPNSHHHHSCCNYPICYHCSCCCSCSNCPPSNMEEEDQLDNLNIPVVPSSMEIPHYDRLCPEVEDEDENEYDHTIPDATNKFHSPASPSRCYRCYTSRPSSCINHNATNHSTNTCKQPDEEQISYTSHTISSGDSSIHPSMIMKRMWNFDHHHKDDKKQQTLGKEEWSRPCSWSSQPSSSTATTSSSSQRSLPSNSSVLTPRPQMPSPILSLMMMTNADNNSPIITPMATSLPPTSPQSSSTTVSSSSLLITLLLLCSFMLHTVDSCSSRSTPKPRPPAPTTRPNITFQTYTCPEAYAKWYCLNGATCFSVRIGESILYNCECANGYMGQRCEFKDLEGSYPGMPSRESKILEAGLAGGYITLAIVFTFVILLSYYTYLKNQMRMESSSSSSSSSHTKLTTPLLTPPSSSSSSYTELNLDIPLFVDDRHHNLNGKRPGNYSTFATATIPKSSSLLSNFNSDGNHCCCQTTKNSTMPKSLNFYKNIRQHYGYTNTNNEDEKTHILDLEHGPCNSQFFSKMNQN